ncbi:MAG: hypothetical protein ACLFPX_01170 [Candidatus Omnitrophota bacterium]
MNKLIGLLTVMILAGAGQGFAQSANEFCRTQAMTTDECPAPLCEWRCQDENCEKNDCRAKSCETLSAEECPLEFCEQRVNCRGNAVCVDRIIDPPACGDIAYAGQDVPCCDGLVRRCGIQFYDRSCDMYGDRSVYAFPICIPCGDGICTNFENGCNCPEDCDDEREPYSGQLFDQELEAWQEEQMEERKGRKNQQRSQDDGGIDSLETEVP